MKRREFLGLAALPLLQFRDRQDLGRSPGSVISSDGSRADGVELIRDWNGPLCRSRIVNHGITAVRVKHVVLVDADLKLPPATSVYGEGFQMLTQTGGTLAAPIDLSQYTDARHYRIPASQGARVLRPADAHSTWWRYLTLCVHVLCEVQRTVRAV